jgi:hypothetical protein
MTDFLPLPDTGSYVDMTADDQPTTRVRVVRAGGTGLTLAATPATVPRLGAAVTLRWSAAPRGRYALPCEVVQVAQNLVEAEVRGAPLIEQQREFVRGGSGERVIMGRAGLPAVSGWVRDISEHSMRGHFQGTDVRAGEDLQLWIELDGEIIETAAVAAKVAALPQRVPPGPLSVELIAIFELGEPQARAIRRYVMRQQLLTRARA